jgi:L-alanine-DL-glutamate epimerase-like enolase superfamily enzyme
MGQGLEEILIGTDPLRPDFSDRKSVTCKSAGLYCWKSGIGIAASAHLCTATAQCPYIEFLPAALSRRELVKDELQMLHGTISLPQKPGLGVGLNYEAIKKYEVV